MAILVLIAFQAADLVFKLPDLLLQFDDFLFCGIGTRFMIPDFFSRIRKHRFISLFDLMELFRISALHFRHLGFQFFKLFEEPAPVISTHENHLLVSCIYYSTRR
ncbi:MAG: hypothetical protein ACOX55_01645 [Christensenellales bacterium]